MGGGAGGVDRGSPGALTSPKVQQSVVIVALRARLFSLSGTGQVVSCVNLSFTAFLTIRIFAIFQRLRKILVCDCCQHVRKTHSPPRFVSCPFIPTKAPPPSCWEFSASGERRSRNAACDSSFLEAACSSLMSHSCCCGALSLRSRVLFCATRTFRQCVSSERGLAKGRTERNYFFQHARKRQQAAEELTAGLLDFCGSSLSVITATKHILIAAFFSPA